MENLEVEAKVHQDLGEKIASQLLPTSKAFIAAVDRDLKPVSHRRPIVYLPSGLRVVSGLLIAHIYNSLVTFIIVDCIDELPLEIIWGCLYC